MPTTILRNYFTSSCDLIFHGKIIVVMFTLILQTVCSAAGIDKLLMFTNRKYTEAGHLLAILKQPANENVPKKVTKFSLK